MILSLLLNVWCLPATGGAEVRAEVDAIRPSAAEVLEKDLGTDSVIDVTVSGLHSPRIRGMKDRLHPPHKM